MLSSCEPSAVYYEIGACDVGGAIAPEEDGCVGDILRLPEPRPGSAPVGILQERRILPDTRPARLDLARRNAVADDQVLSVITRNLAGDIDRPGFADTIGRLPRARHNSLL